MKSDRPLLDRLPLGPIMATAFAAALAFAIFAMPDWRLAQAVVASGLPDVFPPARPPLGLTARALVMLIAAAAGGAGVWALFAWIERPRARHRFAAAAPRRAPRAERAAETPTLRRADAHPDAPPRRPIFAAEDLGAPLDDAPVPAWRSDARQLTAVAPPLPTFVPPASVADAPELLLDAHFAEDAVRADSASELMARLEAAIARRGSPPRPDARLRDAVLQATG